MQSQEKLTYSAQQLAQLFSLTERRIQQLASEGIVPRVGKDKYDVVGAIKGYIAFLRDQAAGRTGDPYKEEKTRLTKLQADEKALQVKQLAGELVAIDEVKAEWLGIIRNVRTKLLALPTTLVSKLQGVHEPEALQAILHSAIEALLRDLST